MLTCLDFGTNQKTKIKIDKILVARVTNGILLSRIVMKPKGLEEIFVVVNHRGNGRSL